MSAIDTTKGVRAASLRSSLVAMTLTVVPAPATQQRSLPLVGIGASAGGLESLEGLFAAMPADTGMVFVVIQHLSPTHRSMMPELLSRVTKMRVRVAADGDELVPNTVNLIPPGQFLTVVEGRLHLEPKPPAPSFTLPIDRFFESMAALGGDDAIAIVLSGTGSDGTRGALALRAAGGLVLVESPSSARFDGMPRSVIDAKAYDLVGTLAELANFLARIGSMPTRLEGAVEPTVDPLLEILRLLCDTTGVDFENYKRGTVKRRIGRRMNAHGLIDPLDYLTLLGASAEERELLLRELLIRVTSFFRDPEVWDGLVERVIRPLVAEAPERGVLRLWVAACSTGEEAYSLAMVVLDEIEAQGRSLELRVFATDIDREGLELAAQGRYRPSQLAGVSDERRERYFNKSDGAFTVSPQLRRCVMFAHHDVTSDAPFTRLDLVSCRNLFIYLNGDLQSRVLGAFHFALKPGGALMLGASETLSEVDDLFAPIEGGKKLFRTTGTRRGAPWSRAFRAPELAPRRDAVRTPLGSPSMGAVDRSARMLAERYSPPAVLVEASGRVRHVFGDVGEFLRLRSGAAQLNVLDMSRPEIRAALTAGLPRALRTGDAVSFPALLDGVEPDDGGVVVRVTPVNIGGSDEYAGALVAFERARGASSQLPGPLDPLRVQLEELQGELQRSHNEQQHLVEQLETFNEELQATNEEMVAANEELQATNEELQSVNEELFTVNAENTRRIHELEVLRHDLDHLLEATDVGTLVVDGDLVIRRFTPSVAAFLPILERDVGRPVSHLANTLGGQLFLDDVATVARTGETCERSIDSVVGPVLMRMIPYRMRELDGVLITFVNVSTVKRNFELSRRVLDALPAHIAVLDRDGVITMVNAAWERFAAENGGDPRLTGPGANYLAAADADTEAASIAAGLRAVLSGEVSDHVAVYPCDGADGTERWFLVQCTSAGQHEAAVVHFDITAQKQAERLLVELATHDPLTGVLNRRGIEAELEVVLRRSRRTQRPACAVMLDCDDFKRINDRVGHAGGDAVLRTVARRIAATLRAGDLLARIGGDEFLVLLPEAAMEAAQVAAERIRLAVGSEAVAVSGDDITLTVSACVVPLSDEVHSLEHLIDCSHEGLRSSKQRGKNTVSASAGSAWSTRRAELTTMMNGNQLGVAAQAIVTTDGAQVVGAELLTRQVVAPFTPPSTIFRVAMEEGMLSIIDEHVLRRCLEVAGSLELPGARHVNVYPSTLLAMSPERIDAIFAGASSDEHPLVIELSEQQLLGDPADLVHVLDRLRSHDVQISLDDVGFGRTPLETLIVVEPHIVKIDSTFIHGVHTSEARRRNLHRLVQATRALGACLIAEGVEQRSELAVVEELGIELCQGYLFAEPVLVS